MLTTLDVSCPYIEARAWRSGVWLVSKHPLTALPPRMSAMSPSRAASNRRPSPMSACARCRNGDANSTLPQSPAAADSGAMASIAARRLGRPAAMSAARAAASPAEEGFSRRVTTAGGAPRRPRPRPPPLPPGFAPLRLITSSSSAMAVFSEKYSLSGSCETTRYSMSKRSARNLRTPRADGAVADESGKTQASVPVRLHMCSPSTRNIRPLLVMSSLTGDAASISDSLFLTRASAALPSWSCLLSLRVYGGFMMTRSAEWSYPCRPLPAPVPAWRGGRAPAQSTNGKRPPGAYISSEPAAAPVDPSTSPKGILCRFMSSNLVVGDSRPSVVAAMWRAAALMSSPSSTFSIRCAWPASPSPPGALRSLSAAAMSSVPVPQAGSTTRNDESSSGGGARGRARPASSVAAGTDV